MSDSNQMETSGVVDVDDKGVGKHIPGPELETHVARLAKRGEGGYTGYEEEYLILDQRSDNNFFGDFQEALKHVNRAKNRYSNVLPLDRTRVVLSCTDEPGSDYINANFVDGVYEKQYIATQGPLKETAEDYWRMVWEQDVNVVVMLTKVTENSKIKCYKYWPGKTKGKTFGQFAVALVSKEKEHGLVTRVVSVVRSGDASTAREVFHFQYKEGPTMACRRRPPRFATCCTSWTQCTTGEERYWCIAVLALDERERSAPCTQLRKTWSATCTSIPTASPCRRSTCLTQS